MAEIKMKIQLSPVRILKDVTTVWSEHGPEVDIVMDLKNLTFAPGSIEEMYTFHVLDHLFLDELVPAIMNWRKCLKIGGKVYNTVDDFEYISRAFVGGDIDIELVNEMHSTPTHFTRDYLAAVLKKAGFSDASTHIWFSDVPNLFPKKHYELIMDSIKND